MDVVPTIRTPREKPAREIYDQYLQSQSWRITRNHALRRARYECSKCSSKRNLQVHHKTYERLGREWDQDLEVVCEDCHGNLHLEAMRADDHGKLYLKLANDALREKSHGSIADLADIVKTRCAALRIRYESHQVDKALALLTGQRMPAVTSPEPTTERQYYPPLSRPEACRIWEELTEQGLPLEQLNARQNEETKARAREDRERFRAQAEQAFRSKCQRCQELLDADQLERGERFCSASCSASAGVICQIWEAAKARVLASVARCEALERDL